MPGTITVRIINGMTNADDKDVAHLTRDFLVYGGVNSLSNYTLYDDSFNPTQNGTPDTNTLIDAGIAYVPDSTTAPTMYYCVQMDGTNLVAHDATAANPRIDAVVIEIPATSTADADATNAAQLSVVKGAEAGSPTAPSDGDITTDLGHSRWLRLANVTIANPFVTVVDADIADVRVSAKWNLGKGVVPDGNFLEILDATNTMYYRIHHDGTNVVHQVDSATDNHYWNDAGDVNRLRLSLMTGGDSNLVLFRDNATDYGAWSYNSITDRFELTANSKSIAITPNGVLLIQNTIFPTTNNSYNIGSVANHHTDVFGQNAYTTVSDANEKENISESLLGLDFVAALAQLTKCWTWKNSLVSKPVLDENGNNQYDEEGHIIMEQVMQTHHRKHHGFLAQDIETLLTQQNISTEDFGGFIKDTETGKYGLRMGELYAPIIKAIGELKAQVDALA